LRRDGFPALEQAWSALRRALETRESWVLAVKAGLNDSAAVKDLKTAAANVTAAIASLGPKGVQQAIIWHYLHGQRDFRVQQWREMQQQQQHQREQRILVPKLATPKHKQTLYAKRPAASKNPRSNILKKTPPAALQEAVGGFGMVESDADIIEIALPPPLSLSVKRTNQHTPNSKVSPSKKSATMYAPHKQATMEKRL
jgi:hypothetical protein